MSRPPREYRQDAHTASLFVWMILCASVAAVLFVHSGRLPSRPLAVAEIAGGVALLIFGPVGLAVYLYRARRVWVSVEPSKGITVSGRTCIPWEAIERIERRKPLETRRSREPPGRAYLGLAFSTIRVLSDAEFSARFR